MSLFHASANSLAGILFAIGILNVRLASAWWCYGHMLIAEIARLSLSDDVNDQVDTYMKFLRETANFTKCGPNYVACACWADDLKSDGLAAMAQWHFINIPVFQPGSYVPPGGRPKLWESPSDGNVANKIYSLEGTARDGTHESSSYSSNHRDHPQPNTWEMSFAVANLLHFFGDIHQPLHAATLYSSTFPTGDEGGNLFPVIANNTPWRLHFVWDSMCLTHATEPPRPLSAAATATITADAKALIKEYRPTFTEAEIHVYEGMIMANESWTLAKSQAYRNGALKPNTTLTADNYLTQCTTVAQSQVTLAGLRLASELNYLFGGKKKDDGAGTETIMKKQKTLSVDYNADTITHNLRQRYGYRVLSPLSEQYLRNVTHFKYHLQQE